MLGRYFLQTWGIYPLAFLTFAHATPRPVTSQPATSLLPGRCGPRGRESLSGRHGLANITTEGFGQGCKMARKGSGIPPKRGNKKRCLPGTPKAEFVHVQHRFAPTRAVKRGRPAASPPHPVSRAWERNLHTRLHGKDLGKGERSLTLLVAAFSSPR